MNGKNQEKRGVPLIPGARYGMREDRVRVLEALDQATGNHTLPAAEGSAPSLPDLGPSLSSTGISADDPLIQAVHEIGDMTYRLRGAITEGSAIDSVRREREWQLSLLDILRRVQSSGKDGAQPSAASNLPCAVGAGSLAAAERGEFTHDPATCWHCQNAARVSGFWGRARDAESSEGLTGGRNGN